MQVVNRQLGDNIKITQLIGVVCSIVLCTIVLILSLRYIEIWREQEGNRNHNVQHLNNNGGSHVNLGLGYLAERCIIYIHNLGVFIFALF